MTLYIPCGAEGEHNTRPAWCAVELSPAFLHEVGRLAAICEHSKVDQVRVSGYPFAEMGPIDHGFGGDPEGVEGVELVVERYPMGTTEWWITGYAEHCDYTVNSARTLVDDAEQWLKGEKGKYGAATIVEGHMFHPEFDSREAIDEVLEDLKETADATE
jgi:hypothetical protein